MSTPLELCEQIAKLDLERSLLELELALATGQSYDQFVGGVAMLLEPVGGHEPGSRGQIALQRYREQFGGAL